MADISIYGRLRNKTSDGVIASTDQLRDEKLGKMQETINQEVGSKLNSLASKSDVVYFGGVVSLTDANITVEPFSPANWKAKDLKLVRNLRPVTGSADVAFYYVSNGKYYDAGNVELTEAALYVDVVANKVYRADEEVKQLIEVQSSAAVYANNHAQKKGAAFASGLYKITTNAEGHVTAATPVTKADITALGIPGAQTAIPQALTDLATKIAAGYSVVMVKNG